MIRTRTIPVSASAAADRIRIVVLATVAVLLLATVPASAQDFSAWAHQRPVEFTNPGGLLTDYQVRVDLNAGNFDFALAQPDGADLRFLDADGTTVLPYWIETWDPVVETATVWVRVTDLPAAGTKEGSLLYGNSGAAAASDGAATFLFYSGFEELVGGAGLNAPAPLVTPTYDGSGQVVHPDVVHVPGGWNGYEYWMGMTPYPNSNDNYENPSVLASNDNVTWVVPPGVVNPLAPEPPGHNDDADMLLVDGEMFFYYNETNNDGNTYVKLLRSTDGADWGTAQTVMTMPNYVMSPAVIHDNGVWSMWYVRSPGGCTSAFQDLYLRTSTDGVTWGPEQACTFDHPGRVLWHLDVQLNNGVYTMLFISYPDGSSCGNTTMYCAESSDGLAWTANPNPFLERTPSGWDSSNIYRGSFTIDGTFIRLWYSAMSTSGQWRVGYTEGQRDDFITEPANTWSQLVGNVSATTDHPRTGTHGLREVGGSTYPQVFGALAGTGVCVNVWYWEEMSTATNFMALLRLWDPGTATYPAHCVGTGIWTGTSLVNYAYHTEGFSYTATALPRTSGWRHLSIAAGASSCELRVDGTPVATLSVLDPALIDRFSVEGYRGGTGYFDDAYVRAFADPEPTVTIGAAGAPNTIAVDAAAVGAITTVTPCATAVPVTIARTDATPVRGFSVTFGLSPELALCDNVNSSILAGSYLDGFGDGAQFYAVDNLDGTYTVDAVVLGLPCGATADQGTLFTVDLTGTVAEGTGTVTVLAVELRDCANQALEVDAGPAAAIAIDTVVPLPVTDLAAAPSASGNGAGRTVAVDLSWTGSTSPDAALVAVYRQGFGDYPEYDDGTGVEPTLDPGATPADAEAAGWTLVDITAESATTDLQPGRDAWSYVAFTEDALGNVSLPAALTAGVVNYLLGDVSDGVVPGGETLPGDGDNQVTGLDVSLLGNYYGLSIGLGHEANRLDIGPLVGDPLLGRPLTDDLIEFEDLILFGINFGLNAQLVKQQALAYDMPPPAAANSLTVEVGAPAAVGEDLVVRLVLAGDGRIQALSVPLTWDASVVEPVAVRSGELLAAQGGTGLALSPRAGTVDIGLLGVRERGISGRGVIAEMAFRVLAAGEPGIGVGEIRARTAKNEAVDLSGTVDVATDTPTALPVVTTLHGAAPNPFNPATTLAYDIATGGRVTLKIYSIDGRLVRTLVDEAVLPGRYSRVWQGRDDGGRTVASGTYVVRLVAPGRTETRRMMLVK